MEEQLVFARNKFKLEGGRNNCFICVVPLLENQVAHTKRVERGVVQICQL